MLDITFVRPRFTADDGAKIARERFGIYGTAAELPSERDQNFRIDVPGGGRYVLKIANTTEDPAVLDLQNEALLHLERVAPDLILPRLVRAVDGRVDTQVDDRTGRAHTLRLLTFVEGRTLADVLPHTPDLLRSVGTLLGRLDRALLDFSHPAADRSLKWDPQRAGWVRDFVADIPDETRRALVTQLFAAHTAALEAVAAELPRSVIYNDANDHNVLVTGDDPYTRQASSVIDFGDMLRAWTVNELAVAAAYAMLDKPDPLTAAAAIVAGYHAERPLTLAELDALLPLIVRRLCVSVVNSAHQRRLEPGNAYLFVTERPAWTLLEQLDAIHPRFALAKFREACGLEPCPTSSAVVTWLRDHQHEMGPLLEPPPAAESLQVLDLSVGAGVDGTWRPTSVGRVSAPTEVGAHDSARDESAGPVFIGRYDEARACYTSETFRVPGNDGPEWRTVHIGLDLCAPAGTAVYAPLDGVVFSVADNAGALDYGPTVIVEHRVDGGLNTTSAPADGTWRPTSVGRVSAPTEVGAHVEPSAVVFFTLYGHLSRTSLEGLVPGQRVRRGDRIGTIGTHDENGGWLPHLHFQIVTDMLGRTRDFPGVARPSERAIWLSLCPDPNLVALLPAATTAPRPASTDERLARRRALLGPSLSVSYRHPLSIVRGSMQHLYDLDGRAYLDAVNNVPHVGHCHPRVVEAGQRQMAVLNTNTRYLHDTIVQYAERLTATFPDPLRVCFVVNSGSEANELALRLARAATGSRETIVVDAAYHGNTTTLVDISPYKHAGPGGSGAPAWVHTVPLPDTYRGLYREPETGLGVRYASHVADAVARLAASGGRIGCFIAESILSCGGQIVLPDGYLAHVYDAVRAAGGVCIADEVQVGMGRVGTHFWAFETQGVVPDIVTIGKPAGNGHPLGAVVTTRAIAETFANGMEYFNTFGGNPVSCAIGLAVLDVIRDEHLQERALDVGTYLMSRLRGLAPTHPLIGDVRGLGLFIGVELVRNRATREPADHEASYIANRMRDRGVLLSTDGPCHNVLKIKPPLVFTRADADTLVETMGIVASDFSRTRLGAD